MNLKIKKTGINKFALYNIYHLLTNISWGMFFLFIFLYFVLISIVFATGYYVIDGKSLINLNVDYSSWIDNYFFTIQTLTAGQSKVENNYTNILSSFVSLIGMLTFAIITGVLYGRFSKPSAKLFHSNKILTQSQGKYTSYNIRIANAKLSKLIELKVQLIIGIDEMFNGNLERRFYYVDLLNDSLIFLDNTWLITHVSDKESPLYNLEIEDLKNKNIEFNYFIKAIDDTYASEVMTSITYSYKDIQKDAIFEPIISQRKKITIIDFKKINSYQELN